MAVWSKHKVGSLNDLENYLNGVIVSRFNAHDGVDVDSLTLILDTSGTPRTVTFTPAKSRPWTLAEIVAKINGAHGDLAGLTAIEVISGSGKSWRRLTVGTGVTFTIKGTGTANTAFGFVSGTDTVAVPIVDTDVFSIQPIAGERDTWVVLLYA